MNGHLAVLFYTEDLNIYGFDEILKPLDDGLKSLETKGVQLPYIEEPLFDSVIQVPGDNCSLNNLLGFVCRFCLITKEETQSVFTKNNPALILHYRELHNEHCNTLSEDPALPVVYGVKKSMCAHFI